MDIKNDLLDCILPASIDFNNPSFWVVDDEINQWR